MKKTLSFVLALALSLVLFSTALTENGIAGTVTGTISQLESEKTITVSVTGNTINHTDVRITNETNTTVTAMIDHGTWFESNSSSAQNMLVTSNRTVELASNETRTISVPTACMNMSRDIPDSSTTFSVGYDPSSTLAMLAKYVDENDCVYEVIQSAVWIITDNATDKILLNVLVNQNGNSVIQQSHIDEARRIIAGL